MATQSKANPDYVTTKYCDTLHSMQEKRFDKLEANQERQSEKLNEIHAILTNGIKTEIGANSKRITALASTHKWILRSFVGLLMAIIVNILIMVLK